MHKYAKPRVFYIFPYPLSLGFRSHNSNICSHLLNNISFHPIKEVIVVAAIRIGEKAIRIGGKDNEASIII